MARSVASLALLVQAVIWISILGMAALGQQEIKTFESEQQPIQIHTQQLQAADEQALLHLIPPPVQEEGIVRVPNWKSVPSIVMRFVVDSLFGEEQQPRKPPKIVVVDQASFIIDEFPPINKGQPIGDHIQFTLHWPEDILDIDMWIGYGIFVGCITLIPVSVGFVIQVVLCHIWTVRKCGLLGGSKPRKDGYSCTHRMLLRLVYFGFVLLVVASSLIGIISNGIFATGSLGVIHSGFGAVDTAFQLFDDVIADLRSMNRNISNTFEASIGMVDDIDLILTPIQSLGAGIISGAADINRINDRLDLVDGNTTQIKSNLAFLFDEQLEFKCFGVPPADWVPNLTGAIRVPLSAASSTMGSIGTAVSDMSTSVNSSLNDAQTTSISFIQQLNTTVVGQINQILDSIVYYKELVEYQIVEFMYGFDRQDIHNFVTYAEYIRAAVVTCFFLFAVIIFGLGIFVIFTENKCGISLMALATWFAILIYFFLAGIAFGLFSVTNEFCANKEGIFQRYSQPNIYNLTNEIINCEGDTTLIDIVRNELANFFPEIMSINVTDLLDEYRGQFQDIRSQFQVATLVQNVASQVDVFQDTTSLIPTGLMLQNVTQLVTASHNITYVESPEDSPYSFDLAAYQTEIDQINSITTTQVTPPISFTVETFGDFNPYEAPINESSPAVRSDLETRYANTRTMYSEYTNHTQEISSIETSIADVQTGTDNVNTETNAITSEISTRLVTAIPTQFSATLQQVLVLATGFDNNITGLYDRANSLLDGILDMQRFSQCAWVGETYRSVESNVCDRMIISISFMGISCIATGITMAIMFPLLLMLSKRVTRRFGNPFASLSENDEGPQNREMRTLHNDEYSGSSRSRSGSYSSTGSSYSSDYSR